MRTRLGMQAIELTDAGLERIEEIIDAERAPRALTALESLPPRERQAVEARVLDDRPYGEIASELRLSEAVVRKRVSRGLRRLRSHLGKAG